MAFHLQGAVHHLLPPPAPPPFVHRIFAPAHRVLPNTPIPPPVPSNTSYHFAMLLDAGRVPHVAPGPWCGVMNGHVPLPNAFEAVGAAILQRQRQAIGFHGFKSTAATLLLGADENGMLPAQASAYLASGLFKQHLAGSVMSSIGQFRRCVIRVEVWMSTVQADGEEKEDDQVTVNGDEYHVPFIFKCNRHTVATAAQLANALTSIVTAVRLFIDQLPQRDGSSRVLERLIGAHVWATPSNAAVPFVGPAGAGILQRPGVIDSKSLDGRCFGRRLIVSDVPSQHGPDPAQSPACLPSEGGEEEE